VGNSQELKAEKTSPEQRAAIEKLLIPVSSTTVGFDVTKTDPIYAKLVTLMKAHPDMVDVYDSVLNSGQTEIVNNGLQSAMLGEQTPQQIAEAPVHLWFILPRGG
jgi:ABC-type glycerol-3-phosphate transport system substrate-binding protein